MASSVWPAGRWESLKNLIPGWFIPTDEIAVEAYFFGGGAEYWGPFIAPIMTYSLVSIAYSFNKTNLVYLRSSMAQPYVWMASELMSLTPEGSPRLFKALKDSPIKVSWISFVIGLILGLPTTITTIFPAVPLGAYSSITYGMFPFATTTYWPWLGSLLPGANLDVNSSIQCMMLFTLMPFDFLFTYIIVYLIVNWFMPAGLIRSGIVTQELLYPSYRMHVDLWSFNGMIMGLGIWSIWMARHRIKKLLGSLTGSDVSVNGFSGRIAIIILLLAGLVYFGFYGFMGMPAIILLILILGQLLQIIGGARIWAEWTHMQGDPDFIIWPGLWHA